MFFHSFLKECDLNSQSVGSQLELPLNGVWAQSSNGLHLGDQRLPWPLFLCLFSLKLKMGSTAEHCGASKPRSCQGVCSQGPAMPTRPFRMQTWLDLAAYRRSLLTTMQRGREPGLRAGPIPGPAAVGRTCSGVTRRSGVVCAPASTFAIPTVSAGGNWRSCFLEIAGVIWRTAQEP